ncbi:MAG: hypothetical protein CMP67_04905 [Flavobacteriales bacterium]|nr:hypothetical protein [Flavobacteriales bacterium]
MKLNKFLKESSIYIVLSFIQKGLSFLLVPFYTVFLSPHEFGLVNQVIALHSIYILIISFSLNEAIAKGIMNDESEGKKKVRMNIVLLNFGLVLFGTLILLIFKPWLYSNLLKEANDAIIYCSIVIVASTPIFFIYQKFLRMIGEPMRYARTMIAFIVLQVLFSVVYIYLFDLGSLGYMLAIASVSSLFGCYSYFKLAVFDKSFISLSEIKQHFTYSLKLIPHSISGWGMNGFTNYALGKLGQLASVGILNAINIVGVLINVVSKSILDALQPWIYTQLKEKEKNHHKIKQIVNLLCGLMVGIGIFIIMFDEFFLKIALPEKYYEGIIYAPFLVLNSVILAMGSMTVYVIYYFDSKVKYVSISTLTGAVINIILGYILIKNYEIIGAITSLVITNFIITIIKSYISSRIIKLPYNMYDLYAVITGTAFAVHLYPEYKPYVCILSLIYLGIKLFLLAKRLNYEQQ